MLFSIIKIHMQATNEHMNEVVHIISCQGNVN